MSVLKLLSSVACFDGKQERYQHYSSSNKCDMTFGVYLPPGAGQENELPVVYWLSGLTCNDENFVQKASAQKMAAKLSLIIVTPDTSPRGENVPDDPEKSWDFGLGAGFYVNATQTPWSANYHMFDYVNHELPELIRANFPCNSNASIFGHSMGGHGALVSALRFPEKYKSVSAFAPICHPTRCPWGNKAFSNYLGKDEAQWKEYDTCELIKAKGLHCPALVDQGAADSFLEEQLKPNNLKAVAKGSNNIQIDIQEGYDHSYFFIATFIEKHLQFHAQHLGSK